MCEMFCQIVQKKREEKRIEEEQAAKAQNSKIPACSDDDDDYNFAITPNEPVDSLSMGDEHLNTISATKSDEFIKSCVEILSLSNEDFPEEIFSNPLFEEEIIPMKIDQHHFDAESDLIESMLNRDSSIISSSSKIDSLLDEFAGELTLLKSISPGIDKTDCYHENDIRILNIKMMGDVSDQKVPIHGLTITRVSNQEKSLDLLSHRGLENFRLSAKRPMMIHGKNTPILDVPLFYFYPLDQFKFVGNWVKLSDLKQTPRGRHPMLIRSLVFSNE
uniref:Uncharacterized protein n=1 Tax=Tanacetum cinerariifolium TaxID=118510 RepID=A0A6L2P4W6_TANCI|nr:hypothetical protein [Tanacetum cinerariifolium]GEV39944.1 hypothetical protein [Tanacetum cinerariifolium]